jgi:hypothetical protein
MQFEQPDVWKQAGYSASRCNQLSEPCRIDHPTRSIIARLGGQSNINLDEKKGRAIDNVKPLAPQRFRENRR